MKKANFSLTSIKENILLYGIINGSIFIILFFLFRSLSLLHNTYLYILNYVILGVISCYQIKKLVVKYEGYIPFLKAFGITFFTGSLSFLIFALFIYLYSKIDPYLISIYFNVPGEILQITPFIITLMEGMAGSMIVGLITLIYSEKFKDGN